MFAVIGLHTFCGSRGFEFAHVLYLLCGVGVPFFFMSSGFLLLGRENVSWGYVLLKIYHIIRLVFCVSLIYTFVICFFTNKDSFTYFISLFSGAFIQTGDLWVCWYLGAMILVYILYPLVNQLYNSEKSFFLFVFLLFIFELVIFYMNVSWGGWEKLIIQTFRIWNWLFYFCLGGLLKMSLCKQPDKTKLLILFILSYLGFIYLHDFLVNRVGEDACEYYYSSIFVILMASSLFLFFMYFKIEESVIISFLANLLLPVYLFHPLVLSIIMYPPLFSVIHAEWMPFYLFRFVMVSLISVTMAWMIMKVPILSNLLKL